MKKTECERIPWVMSSKVTKTVQLKVLEQKILHMNKPISINSFRQETSQYFSHVAVTTLLRVDSQVKTSYLGLLLNNYQITNSKVSGVLLKQSGMDNSGQNSEPRGCLKLDIVGVHKIPTDWDCTNPSNNNITCYYKTVLELRLIKYHIYCLCLFTTCQAANQYEMPATLSNLIMHIVNVYCSYITNFKDSSTRRHILYLWRFS